MKGFVGDIETRKKDAARQRKWQHEHPHYNGWKQYNKRSRQLGEDVISYKEYVKMIKEAPKDLMGRALLRARGRRKNE